LHAGIAETTLYGRRWRFSSTLLKCRRVTNSTFRAPNEFEASSGVRPYAGTSLGAFISSAESLHAVLQACAEVDIKVSRVPRNAMFLSFVIGPNCSPSSQVRSQLQTADFTCYGTLHPFIADWASAPRLCPWLSLCQRWQR
jgi:hypothetical protein